MPERLSRQELYDLVWSQPMSKLADRFGISNVALKKTCARAEIPTPDRGYWAKKESGKPAIQVTLSRRPPGMSDEVLVAGGDYWYRSWPEEELLKPVPVPEFPEPIEAVKEWITREVGKISVPREIRAWYPAIERLLKEDENRREECRTKGYSWIKPLFESPLEQRRLRILNSIFFGAGKMSGKSRIGNKEGRDISIRFHDSSVRISLERIKQPGPKGGPSLENSDHINPLLFLGIHGDTSSDATVMSWVDDEAGKLERKLTQIVTEVILRAEINNRDGTVHSYQWRIKRKAQIEEEQRQRKIRAEREEIERRARLEQARVDRLMRDSAAFECAAQIRRYVESIRSSVAAGAQSDPEQIETWSQWALAQANRIDPALEERYLKSIQDHSLGDPAQPAIDDHAKSRHRELGDSL